MGQGQDDRRSALHQEHRHREGTGAAAGEDSLLGARRGRDSRRDQRLAQEKRCRGIWRKRRVEETARVTKDSCQGTSLSACVKTRFAGCSWNERLVVARNERRRRERV